MPSPSEAPPSGEKVPGYLEQLLQTVHRLNNEDKRRLKDLLPKFVPYFVYTDNERDFVLIREIDTDKGSWTDETGNHISLSEYLHLHRDDAMKLFSYSVLKVERFLQRAYPPSKSRDSDYIELKVEDVSVGLATLAGITIDADFIRKLWHSALKDEQTLHIYQARVESTIVHEYMHDEHMVDEGGAMLGEFLYDPHANRLLNDILEIFVQGIKTLVLEGKTPETRFANKPHWRSWMSTSKILLYEYKILKSDFSIPPDLQGQLDLLNRLPEFYAKVPEAERISIMRKYLNKDTERLGSEEWIKQQADRCGNELGLKY